MATARTTQHKKNLFLQAYVETGTITHAAQAAGIGRRTHYNWLDEDEDYAVAFADAEQAAMDMLEGEARRRGFAGSDTLLIFLLKGGRPEKYADRRHITGEVRSNLDAGQLIDQAEAKVLQYIPGGRSQTA